MFDNQALERQDLLLLRLEEPIGQSSEFQAKLAPCPNPNCNCGEAVLVIQDGNFDDKKRDLKGIFLLDLEVKQEKLRIKDVDAGFHFNPGYMQFALRNEQMFDAVKAQIRPDDWKVLRQSYYALKAKLIEEVPLEYIDADFGAESLADPSIMFLYHEVFPQARIWNVELDGKVYDLYDMYCVDDKCLCTNMNLNLVIDGKQGYTIFYDYSKSEAKTADTRTLSIEEASRVMAAIFKKYPSFNAMLHEANNRMRLIYRKFRQKNETKLFKKPTPAPQGPSGLGVPFRN